MSEATTTTLPEPTAAPKPARRPPKPAQAVTEPDRDDLDELTRDRIDTWMDRKARNRATKAIPTEDDPADKATLGTQILVDYLDARLSGPNPFMQDAHVHPDLKAAALSVLNRVSGLRVHQIEQVVRGRMQVVEEFEVGMPFPVIRPDGRKFVLYVHPVLLNVTPDPGAAPVRMDGPHPGEIALYELPRTYRDVVRRPQAGHDDLDDLDEPEIR